MSNGQNNEARRDITERTFRFGGAVVTFTMRLSKTAGANRALANQLMRSGTSVGANMEEAQAAQSRKDFIAKCSIALKEAREARYWIRLLIAAGIHAGEPAPTLVREVDELVRIISTIVVRCKENA
jgi:four helix bundle protein